MSSREKKTQDRKAEEAKSPMHIEDDDNYSQDDNFEESEEDHGGEKKAAVMPLGAGSSSRQSDRVDMAQKQEIK